jgi:hypothetical protein
MAFTYELTTDIGKVRLEIGDTNATSGVKPDGLAFDDDELQVFLDAEGHVMRAAARACEVLGRSWATVTDIRIGPRSENLGAVAKTWSDQAARLRATWGDTPSAGTDAGPVATVYTASVATQQDEWASE